MFHLNEAFINQEMPARARRLFVKTFKKYHKLDGGDEDVALHMAKQAVDREYVKLNDRWIPKSAAEEIVRHDLDEDSLSDTDTKKSSSLPAASAPDRAAYVSSNQRKRRRRRRQDEEPVIVSEESDYEDDDDYTSHDDSDYYDDDDDGGHINKKKLFFQKSQYRPLKSKNKMLFK